MWKWAILILLLVVFGRGIVGNDSASKPQLEEAASPVHFDEESGEPSMEEFKAIEDLKHSFLQIGDKNEAEQLEAGGDEFSKAEETPALEKPSNKIDFDNLSDVVENFRFVENKISGKDIPDQSSQSENHKTSLQLEEEMFYADQRSAEEYNYEVNGGAHVDWSAEDLEMMEKIFSN